jgi:hypothetical protein
MTWLSKESKTMLPVIQPNNIQINKSINQSKGILLIMKVYLHLQEKLVQTREENQITHMQIKQQSINP